MDECKPLFDGGFLTFVLPLILDGIFNKWAPWLFQVGHVIY